MSIFASLSTDSVSNPPAGSVAPVKPGLSSSKNETDSLTVANVTLTVNETEYAVRRRQHLDLIKQLRAIG